MNAKQVTDLYRHFDADGRLLYVGISLSAAVRFQSHRNESRWSRDAVTMTIQKFPDRESALKAEAKAILEEKPLHNIAGSHPVKRKLRTRPPERKRRNLLDTFKEMGITPKLHP